MTEENPRPIGDPTIVYLAADLLWATKIKAAADAIGVAARPVRSLAMLEDRLADTPVCALLADLEADDRTFALIDRLKGDRATPSDRRIRVVVFGPHVDRAGLQRARDAGADEVLARGVLASNLDEILLRLASWAGSADSAH